MPLSEPAADLNFHDDTRCETGFIEKVHFDSTKTASSITRLFHFFTSAVSLNIGGILRVITACLKGTTA